MVSCSDHEYVYVEDGCQSENGSYDDHNRDCYDTMTEVATVRCCSDDGAYCESDIDQDCFSSESTYLDAQNGSSLVNEPAAASRW